jgi:methylmalonyl-CoA/ethylmalonyl-CoA epimerase
MTDKTTFSKLDHVGVVVENMERAVAHYEPLGIGPFARLNANVLRRTKTGDRLKTMRAAFGSVGLELIDPGSGESIWRQFLDQKGEGIVHLGFEVGEIDEEETRMVNGGFRLLYKNRFEGGGGVSGLDTRELGGVIMELVKYPPGAISTGVFANEPYSRLHHVGYVVKDLDKAVGFYEGLGFGPFKQPNLPGVRTEASQYGKPVSNRRLRNMGTHIGPTKIELEFLQPVENAPIQEEFLKKRGDGANHFGFKVADVDAESAKLEHKGFRAVYTVTFSSGIKCKYLATDSIGGVLFEFWQPPSIAS